MVQDGWQVIELTGDYILSVFYAKDKPVRAKIAAMQLAKIPPNSVILCCINKFCPNTPVNWAKPNWELLSISSLVRDREPKNVV